MTKSQLIERIAEKAPHVPLRRIEAIVNAVFERMTLALQAGQRIELRGFGCFTVKSRPARMGRNPKTGASVPLQQRSTVAFAAGKELRERLNRVHSPPQPPWLRRWGGSVNLTDPKVGRTFRAVGATGRNTA